MRIDIAAGDEFAARREDLDHLSRLEGLERRRVDVDLIAVDPQVAAQQPALLASPELQCTQCHVVAAFANAVSRGYSEALILARAIRQGTAGHCGEVIHDR